MNKITLIKNLCSYDNKIELVFVSKCFYGLKIYLIWIPEVETLKPILHVFTMQAIHATIAQKPIYNLYSHSHQ